MIIALAGATKRSIRTFGQAHQTENETRDSHDHDSVKPRIIIPHGIIRPIVFHPSRFLHGSSSSCSLNSLLLRFVLWRWSLARGGRTSSFSLGGDPVKNLVKSQFCLRELHVEAAREALTWREIPMPYLFCLEGILLDCPLMHSSGSQPRRLPSEPPHKQPRACPLNSLTWLLQPHPHSMKLSSETSCPKKTNMDWHIFVCSLCGDMSD